MIETTKTQDAESITYALTVDGELVSFLTVDAATRKVWNVETSTGHRGRGYARTLWTTANADGECFHDLEHHRTAEGDAFAYAVGGQTIGDEDGHVAECAICSGEWIDEN